MDPYYRKGSLRCVKSGVCRRGAKLYRIAMFLADLWRYDTEAQTAADFGATTTRFALRFKTRMLVCASSLRRNRRNDSRGRYRSERDDGPDSPTSARLEELGAGQQRVDGEFAENKKESTRLRADSESTLASRQVKARRAPRALAPLFDRPGFRAGALPSRPLHGSFGGKTTVCVYPNAAPIEGPSCTVKHERKEK